MNESFDLCVFIVLVAAYFVFRISLTLPRSDQPQREATKRPLSHQKQSSPPPDTRHVAFRQANDDCQPRRSAEASRTTASLARVRAADEPSSACIASLHRGSMPRHSGWPQLCNNAGNGRPMRSALAAGNAWVSENAQ